MMQKGFTLLETIIYIALFSILITSGFIACYDLISGTDRVNGSTRTQEEGNFVLRKMEWSLSSLDPAYPPTVGGSGCNQNLTTKKTGVTNPVRIRLNTISGINYIEIQDDGVNYYPITTANVSVTCLKFNQISGALVGINATASINGVDFVVKKYVRS